MQKQIRQFEVHRPDRLSKRDPRPAITGGQVLANRLQERHRILVGRNRGLVLSLGLEQTARLPIPAIERRGCIVDPLGGEDRLLRQLLRLIVAPGVFVKLAHITERVRERALVVSALCRCHCIGERLVGAPLHFAAAGTGNGC